MTWHFLERAFSKDGHPRKAIDLMSAMKRLHRDFRIALLFFGIEIAIGIEIDPEFDPDPGPDFDFDPGIMRQINFWALPAANPESAVAWHQKVPGQFPVIGSSNRTRNAPFVGLRSFDRHAF